MSQKREQPGFPSLSTPWMCTWDIGSNTECGKAAFVTVTFARDGGGEYDMHLCGEHYNEYRKQKERLYKLLGT